MSNTAPIALFVYNRPTHTQRTLAALKANLLAESSELLVYSDGCRSAADRSAVAAVRAIVNNIEGFRRVTVFERDRNYGLAHSIISGVTDVVREYGRVIVLEDDLVTSRYFLKFMNEALAFYCDVDEVISIHGYLYPVASKLPETFFLKGADCWGWATWRRGWDLFEPDGAHLLAEIKTRGVQDEFDLFGAYPYTKMLSDQTTGLNNSWAIRWHASAFLKDKLTLYPGNSLVDNIGTDNSGTHCSACNEFKVSVSTRPIEIQTIPVRADAKALGAIENYYRRKPSLLTRIFHKLLR
jgi:hypothetical protein